MPALDEKQKIVRPLAIEMQTKANQLASTQVGHNNWARICLFICFLGVRARARAL